MGETLRIGLIGAGTNTRERHIPGFQALEDVQLVAVANRSGASSGKVAEAFEIPRVAESWQAIVEDPAIDAVCIGTWPYLHAEATIAALAAGKHVLCEARMAMNLAEARAMAEAAAERPQLVAQLVPAPFSLDLDACVRRLLADGCIGELRFAHVQHLTGVYASADLPFSWRQDVARSGKNMLTLGICHEMLQRWLPPELLIAEVSAAGHIATPERYDPASHQRRPVELPEMITVTGRFANGASLLEQYSGLHAGMSRLEIVLGGDAGTLRADLLGGCLWLAEPGEDAEEVAVPEADRRGWQVERDFVHAIRTGAPVRLTSFADGLRYMAFTDAVYAAWQSGRPAQLAAG